MLSTTTSVPPAHPADDLRQQMVEELGADGTYELTESMRRAFGTVPRHLFAEGEPLERVYDTDTSVTAATDAQGVMTSCLSAARMQAAQLAQAQVQAGESVLEIGSGGYNAALLAEIVGPGGSVTTVDIDPSIVELARIRLTAAGYGRVNVVLADAEHGIPAGGPYDRIIVTVASWDIPPAWIEQLKPSGRIVIPLRFAGLHRSVGFDKTGDGLISDSYRLGVFVPMQGDGSHTEEFVQITDGVCLRVRDTKTAEEHNFDVPALLEALRGESYTLWTGTEWNAPDEIDLYLVTHESMPFLHASEEAITSGIVASSVRLGTPVLVEGGSLAFRTPRQNPQVGGEGYETGVLAYGPHAKELADRYAQLLRARAARFPHRGAATFRYAPTTTTPSIPADAWRTRLRHGTLAVSWH